MNAIDSSVIITTSKIIGRLISWGHRCRNVTVCLVRHWVNLLGFSLIISDVLILLILKSIIVLLRRLIIAFNTGWILLIPQYLIKASWCIDISNLVLEVVFRIMASLVNSSLSNMCYIKGTLLSVIRTSNDIIWRLSKITFKILNSKCILIYIVLYVGRSILVSLLSGIIFGSRLLNFVLRLFSSNIDSFPPNYAFNIALLIRLQR